MYTFVLKLTVENIPGAIINCEETTKQPLTLSGTYTKQNWLVILLAHANIQAGLYETK